MDSYELNQETLAVIGISENRCKILEGNRQYIIDKPAYEVMDDSCQYFGSSYDGRVKGTRKILGIKYKIPVIVEESTKMIFFPIESPLINTCTWISLNNFKDVYINMNKTNIVFRNGKKIVTNISSASINNQLLRSTRLESILNYRKNH